MIIDEMTKKQGGIYKEKNKVVKKKKKIKFWQIWKHFGGTLSAFGTVHLKKFILYSTLFSGLV